MPQIAFHIFTRAGRFPPEMPNGFSFDETMLLMPPVRELFNVVCNAFDEARPDPEKGFERGIAYEGRRPLMLTWKPVGFTAGVAHLVRSGRGTRSLRRRGAEGGRDHFSGVLPRSDRVPLTLPVSVFGTRVRDHPPRSVPLLSLTSTRKDVACCW
jgi:hypothetical protein